MERVKLSNIFVLLACYENHEKRICLISQSFPLCRIAQYWSRYLENISPCRIIFEYCKQLEQKDVQVVFQKIVLYNLLLFKIPQGKMSYFKVTDYRELLLLSAAHMISRKKQQSKLQIDYFKRELLLLALLDLKNSARTFF